MGATDPRLELRPNLAIAVLCELVALFVLAMMADDGIAWLIVAAICAVLSVALLVRLARRRLWIDGEGITHKGAFVTTHIAWDEVAFYMYWSSGNRTLVDRVEATGPFGAGCLKVVASDGRAIVIDNAYERAVEAIERAFTAVHPRLRAASHDFDPFTCDDRAVHHARKGAIELHEIEEVKIVDGQFKFRKREAMLPWVSEHMKDVTNSLLFVEALAERRISVGVSGTYIPACVRAQLDLAPAALPAARAHGPAKGR